VDSGEFFEGSSSGSGGLSRRSAALRLGSGGLAVLLASRLVPAVAQEASPMAGTPAAGGAYLASRQYQLAPGHTMEDLVGVVESGFLPIIEQVPGFQEYFLVETEEGPLSISVFTDPTGMDESTRRAADWVQQNLAGFFTGPPAVTTGNVRLHEVGGEMPGTPAP